MRHIARKFSHLLWFSFAYPKIVMFSIGKKLIKIRDYLYSEFLEAPSVSLVPFFP